MAMTYQIAAALHTVDDDTTSYHVFSTLDPSQIDAARTAIFAARAALADILFTDGGYPDMDEPTAWATNLIGLVDGAQTIGLLIADQDDVTPHAQLRQFIGALNGWVDASRAGG